MKIPQYLKKRRCTQSAFAKLVGVSPTTVCLWISGKKRASAKRARHIEKVTGGDITRVDMRADIFA